MGRFVQSARKDVLIELKKKKKTLAELVNEQLSPCFSSASYGADPDMGAGEAGDTLSGAFEEYEWGAVPAQSTPGKESDHHLERKGRKRTRSDERSVPSGVHGGAQDGKRGHHALGSSGSNPKQLRRRGPLDPVLSEGKYAAAPVDVEAAMDDIFGALDMRDLDAEGEELYEPSEDGRDTDAHAKGRKEGDAKAAGIKKKVTEGLKKKGKGAKELSEQEYTEWLTKKQAQKRRRQQSGSSNSFPSSSSLLPRGTGTAGVVAANGEEELILGQLEYLRQCQLQLLDTHSSGSGTRQDDAFTSDHLRPSQEEEVAQRAERIKGSVQHLIMVFSQLLRLRVRLQPAVAKAIRLPQYYAKPFFLECAVNTAEAAETGEPEHAAVGAAEDVTCATVSYDALHQAYACVCEDLNTILGFFFRYAEGMSGSPLQKPVARKPSLDASFLQIERWHRHAVDQANACLAIWSEKLLQPNSAKLKTIAQPLPQQIATILSSKLRLRLKVQKNRSHTAILGHPDHMLAASATLGSDSQAAAAANAKRAMAIAEGDVDVEIFDDGDFLRELVHRGGASAKRLEQHLFDITRALEPVKAAAKKGFHRLTKGKSVNYEPRPKIVGFLVSKGFEDSGRSDVVMRSLFR